MSGEDQQTETRTLSPEQVEATVLSLADRIEAQLGDDRETGTAFVGIYTRGVTLANRVARILDERGRHVPVGALDASLYRDDLYRMGKRLPRLNSSNIPFTLEDTRVILFDDVIFTGRTIRAALDELSDYGRPAKVELAVLVDRGWREIPVQPDYVGYLFETEKDERVGVRFREDDDEDGVFLTRRKVLNDE